MLNRIFILIACICTLNFCAAQVSGKLRTKLDTFRTVLERADTLRPFDERVENIFDTITAVNIEIAERLADLLTQKEILRYNLDSLFKMPMLGSVHSKDKRLWIFNWYENTGGSYRSNVSMVHYRTKSGIPKVDYKVRKDDGDEINASLFCSRGASFEKIYKLKSAGRDLYLCIGSGIGCNTCVYEIATVVELTSNGVEFQYPAFKADPDSGSEKKSSPCFSINTRLGMVYKFKFDPDRQILSYDYDVFGEDGDVIKNRGMLSFDGRKFVEVKRK